MWVCVRKGESVGWGGGISKDEKGRRVEEDEKVWTG